MATFYERGRALYNSQRYEDAVIELGKARAQDPFHVESAILLAWSFYNLRRYWEAVQAGTSAAELDPYSWRAQAVIGAAQASRNCPMAAKKHLERSLELNPDYAFGHYLMAWFLTTSRNPKKALESIDTALELDPENSLFTSYRGHILLALGRNKEALWNTTIAVGLNPDDASTLAVHAEALRTRGQIQEAIKTNLEALRINPTDGSSQKNQIEAIRCTFPPYRWFNRVRQITQHEHQIVGAAIAVGPLGILMLIVGSGKADHLPDAVMGLIILIIIVPYLLAFYSVLFLDCWICVHPKYKIAFTRRQRIQRIATTASILSSILILAIGIGILEPGFLAFGAILLCGATYSTIWVNRSVK